MVEYERGKKQPLTNCLLTLKTQKKMKPSFSRKSISVISVALIVTIMMAVFSFSSSTALAEDNSVSVSVEDGKYILSWRAYSADTSSFNGYVISVDGSYTYLDGYYFTYFDITDLVAGGGEHQISVYASLDGGLQRIGSCLVKVIVSLDKARNIRLSSGFLFWDKVKNADVYLVFINNVFVGRTDEETLYADDLLSTTKDSVIVAIVPFSDSPYHISPAPTYQTINLKKVIEADLDFYVFNTKDGVVISWQPVGEILFSYTLTKDGETISYGNVTSSTLTFETLADGTYSLSVFGEDKVFKYDFGAITFSVENGEVTYE